jgi:hypothetical protein
MVLTKDELANFLVVVEKAKFITDNLKENRSEISVTLENQLFNSGVSLFNAGKALKKTISQTHPSTIYTDKAEMVYRLAFDIHKQIRPQIPMGKDYPQWRKNLLEEANTLLTTAGNLKKLLEK